MRHEVTRIVIYINSNNVYLNETKNFSFETESLIKVGMTFQHFRHVSDV